MEDKKDILIYIGSFFPYEDAITNVMLPLIHSLKEKYNISIYTRSKDGKAPLKEEMMGYHVYRDKQYNGNPKRKKYYLQSRYRRLNLDITAHKWYLLKKLYVWYLNCYSDEKWQKHINRGESATWEQEFSDVLKKKNYLAVLTVSSHIQAQTDALQLAKRGYFQEHQITWIAYFVDPFSTYIRNLRNPDIEHFLKFETEVYQYATAVFTSPEMYEDNLNYPMGKYHEKTIPIQYASMKPLQVNMLYPFFNPDQINCVYIGSFFDLSIRNPEYFFKLISSCDNDIEFYIVCSLSNTSVDGMRKKYLDTHNNIHWYSGKPLHECQEMMASADVLVNVGNEALNQTPSKVFDYIGACKPIVNFYSLDKDTSKKYLEKYPCHMDILNKTDLDPVDLATFSDFAKNSKKAVINKNEVYKIYQGYTADAIAESFRQAFSKLVDTNRGSYEQ